MEEPEGQPVSLLHTNLESKSGALRASLGEKIKCVADEETQRLLYEKTAACKFVKSDPLSVYEKDGKEVSPGRPKRSKGGNKGEEQAPGMQHIRNDTTPVLPPGRLHSSSIQYFQRLNQDYKVVDGQDLVVSGDIADRSGLVRPENRNEIRDRGTENRAGVTRSRKKKPVEDIFQSFGKEHDQQDVRTVDGKLKVNYKRFWQSDPDLGRWRKALATNTRHKHLLFEVQERTNMNFREEQAELKARHNAFARQRHPVEPAELRKKSQAITEIQDMQKHLAPRKHNHKPAGDLSRLSTQTFCTLKDGSAAFASSPDTSSPKAPTHEGPLPIPRTHGEEQVLGLLNCILTYYDSLKDAFIDLDENKSQTLCLREFQTGLASMGFPGDCKYLFHKLDANQNGVISLKEFLQLRPYMLKEMVRILVIARECPDAIKPGNMWLKKARTELAEDKALQEALEFEAEAPEISNFLKSDDYRETAYASRSSDVSEDSAREQSSRLETCVGQEAASYTNSHLPDLNTEDGRSMGFGMARQSAPDLLPEVTEIPKTLTLFIFRNADRASTGEAIFVKNVPRRLEQFLQICAETVKPFVHPVDSLWDTSLRPVKSLHQIKNGGTYLLKGKEALDPPPVFFIPRPPLEKIRYKHLWEAQFASHCEAESRPTTSQSRPNTSVSTWSKASSAFGSLCSVGSSSRVGSLPVQRRKKPIKTWQVSDRLRKELTYGGKNMMPVHKRYDLWTVMDRGVSESSELAYLQSLWSETQHQCG